MKRFENVTGGSIRELRVASTPLERGSFDVLRFPKRRDLDNNERERPENRRDNARIRMSVPFELQTEASSSPIRGATADLSLSGCYIESIYPFPVGTNLDLQLSVGSTVLVAATVVTCDPQVGNGVRFSRMLTEDRETLKAFLQAAQEAQDAAGKPGVI